MAVNMKVFKYICATCRHLESLETGREFDKIIDTEYTKFSCKVRGWESKEFYLMAPTDKDPSKQKLQICEFWEEWIPPETDESDDDNPEGVIE